MNKIGEILKRLRHELWYIFSPKSKATRAQRTVGALAAFLALCLGCTFCGALANAVSPRPAGVATQPAPVAGPSDTPAPLPTKLQPTQPVPVTGPTEMSAPASLTESLPSPTRTPTATKIQPTATSVPPTLPPPTWTQAPPQPTQPPPAANCDPAYPDVCIPPSPPHLNCPQIPYRRFRVLPPDPHGFDRDGDGIGCESG